MPDTLKLKNGVTLLLKNIPTANSVSIGLFSLVSLVQEPSSCRGIAHFLEHMSFKGTKKRTSKQITESVDQMGGHLNAHTTKEYTCYYMTLLPHSYQKGLDILFDLYANSKLETADLELEKQVVLEEINMYEDTPDDHVHDVFSSTIWKGHALGNPILGSADSVKSIDEASLRDFKNHYLNPENLVVAITGKLPSESRLIRLVTEYCSSFITKTPTFLSYTDKATPTSEVSILSKKTEQIHFCFGSQGYAFNHPDHYKATLLSTLLGGSMSSRLFQIIREKRGWAYSVYSYMSFYKNSGLFTIYGGINRDKFIPTLRLITHEMQKLQQKQIAKKELHRVKEQLKGNLMLSLERSASWMNWIARSMIYFDKVNTVDEVIDRIESVTLDDIQLMAQALFVTEKMALAAVGPFSSSFSDFTGSSLTDFLNTKKLPVL